MEAAGLTCHTAPGTTFETREALMAHYRSDWHKYNLKRKVAGLPVIGQALFEQVVRSAEHKAQALADEKRPAPKADHLKHTDLAELRRTKREASKEHQERFRQDYEARRAAVEDVDDDDDDDDDDDTDEDEDEDDGEWEEMSGSEAEEALAELERRRAGGAEEMSEDGDYSSDEEDEEARAMRSQALALVETKAGPMSMAVSGELVVHAGRGGDEKVIGARELARYYRQRPKPQDTRAAVVAAKGSSRERGLTLAANKVFHQVPVATKESQKARRQYVRSQLAVNAMERAVANKQLPRNVPY